MAGTLNKVELIGSLGQNPEVKTTQGGKTLVTFNVATNRTYGEDRQTDWHRVTAWEKLGDLVSQYCVKGSKVYVGGRLQQRSVDNGNGGRTYYTDIIAETVLFLDRAPGNGNGNGNTDPDALAPAPIDPNDLPFED